MNETLFQKEIYTLLSSKGYRVYSDKKYPKIGWFPQTFQGKKKPDLLVFHDFLKFKDVHNRCEKKRLPSPIGIELKLATSIKNITKGIINQLDRKYKEEEYTCYQEQWKGKIPLLAFTTDRTYREGYFFGNCKFVLERFLWRMGIALIIKEGKYLNLSFENQHIKLCKFENG